MMTYTMFYPPTRKNALAVQRTASNSKRSVGKYSGSRSQYNINDTNYDDVLHPFLWFANKSRMFEKRKDDFTFLTFIFLSIC